MSYASERIAERRKALAMLRNHEAGCIKRHDYAGAAAMAQAHWDTERALIDDTGYLISEGVRMSFAHYPYDCAARSAA